MRWTDESKQVGSRCSVSPSPLDFFSKSKMADENPNYPVLTCLKYARFAGYRCLQILSIQTRMLTPGDGEYTPLCGLYRNILLDGVWCLAPLPWTGYIILGKSVQGMGTCLPSLNMLCSKQVQGFVPSVALLNKVLVKSPPGAYSIPLCKRRSPLTLPYSFALYHPLITSPPSLSHVSPPLLNKPRPLLLITPI